MSTTDEVFRFFYDDLVYVSRATRTTYALKNATTQEILELHEIDFNYDQMGNLLEVLHRNGTLLIRYTYDSNSQQIVVDDHMQNIKIRRSFDENGLLIMTEESKIKERIINKTKSETILFHLSNKGLTNVRQAFRDKEKDEIVFKDYSISLARNQQISDLVSEDKNHSQHYVLGNQF